MQDSRANVLLTLLAILALAALVFAIFHPGLSYEFVSLDVGRQIFENPHVWGITWENVKFIFTSRCVTSYYPVRSLTYALDYQFWGMDPTGFKLTNVLIHLANVLLLFWLLLRLFQRQRPAGVRSSRAGETLLAALSTAVFAIHPVVVEPVAWVSGREELLMTLGALACVHFHMTARRVAESGGRPSTVLFYHVLAAISCAAACLSNAVAAVIPALVVAWDLLTLAKPTLGRILSGTAALWAIGIATIVIKKVGEFNNPPNEVGAISAERIWMLLNVFWLNLKSLVWPENLAVFYPNVAPSGPGDREVLLGAAALVLVLMMIWLLRRQRLAVLGIVWFGLALGPSSQIMVHHIHRADRFLYLPLAGLVIAVAMAWHLFACTTGRASAKAGMVALATLLLGAMGARSVAQVWTWRDDVSMSETCVKVDPGNARFRCALADQLRQVGDTRHAIQEYEHLLRLDPRNGEVAVKLAALLVSCKEREFRDYDRAIRLAEGAFANDPAFFRSLSRIRAAVAKARAEQGQFCSAIEGYQLAFEEDPGNHKAMLDLGLLLATCADTSLQNAERAVELAERACLIQGAPDAETLAVVAAIRARAGKRDADRPGKKASR